MFESIKLIVSYATVLLLLIVVLVDGFDKPSILISTESGQIRGSVLSTLLEARPFYSFKGIPYANSPTGERRFKVAEKAKAWPDILNATDFGNICIQKSSVLSETIGSEDCLNLNVFTPNINSQQKMPVIFYIHGGSFYEGSSDFLGPEILLDEDIVLVTINYRLGPFGFLSLDRPEYSGNMGLKDQLLALQWVNDNIHHFGGDKGQIAIYGHSAGSISANFHVLSPKSRGLFQRAILMSGSVYNQFAFGSKNQTEILLKAMEKQNTSWNGEIDMADIVEGLKSVKADYLVSETFSPIFEEGKESKGLNIMWGPVLERKDAVQPFIVDEPDACFEETSDLDTLFGLTSAESIIFTSTEINNPVKLKPFDEHFDVQVPLSLMNINKTSADYASFLNEIRRFYFGDKNVNGTTLNEYTRLLTDTFFFYGIDRAAKKQANRSTGRTYYFQFSIELGLNIFRLLANATQLGVHGCAHIEDIPYIFKTNLVPQSFYDNLIIDSDEVRLIKSLRNYLTNFVKYGNPNGYNSDIDDNIEPIVGDAVNYINFLNNGLFTGVDLRGDAVQFWNRLLDKYAGILHKQK